MFKLILKLFIAFCVLFIIKVWISPKYRPGDCFIVEIEKSKAMIYGEILSMDKERYYYKYDIMIDGIVYKRDKFSGLIKNMDERALKVKCRKNVTI